MADKLVASVIRGNNEYREETYNQVDEKGNIIGIYVKSVPVSQTPPAVVPATPVAEEEKASSSKK